MSLRHGEYLIEGLELPITGITIDVFQIESQLRQSDTPQVSTYEGVGNNEADHNTFYSDYPASLSVFTLCLTP